MLCSASILIAILVTGVNCEEEDSGGSIWERFRQAVERFFEEMRKMWGEFKDEVKARTVDMRSWSTEMWNSFKKTMNDWIDRKDASETEKDEMRNYIERLRMPENENKA